MSSPVQLVSPAGDRSLSATVRHGPDTSARTGFILAQSRPSRCKTQQSPAAVQEVFLPPPNEETHPPRLSPAQISEQRLSQAHSLRRPACPPAILVHAWLSLALMQHLPASIHRPQQNTRTCGRGCINSEPGQPQTWVAELTLMHPHEATRTDTTNSSPNRGTVGAACVSSHRPKPRSSMRVENLLAAVYRRWGERPLRPCIDRTRRPGSRPVATQPADPCLL